MHIENWNRQVLWQIPGANFFCVIVGHLRSNFLRKHFYCIVSKSMSEKLDLCRVSARFLLKMCKNIVLKMFFWNLLHHVAEGFYCYAMDSMKLFLCSVWVWVYFRYFENGGSFSCYNAWMTSYDMTQFDTDWNGELVNLVTLFIFHFWSLSTHGWSISSRVGN